MTQNKTEKIVIRYLFEGEEHIVTAEPWGFTDWVVKEDETWEKVEDETDENLQMMYDGIQNVAEEILEYNPENAEGGQ